MNAPEWSWWKAYRVVIDGSVILMLVFLLYTFGSGYYAGYFGWEDLTIPDEVEALDAEMYAFMETARADFAQLYAEPEPLDSYAFLEGGSDVPLPDKENYARSVESVVYINTYDGFDYYFGAGTILTEDGIILTSNHVVEGAEQVVVTTHDGTTYEVTGVLAHDRERDIAFLKIDAEGLRPMPLGDARAVEVGEKTLVIGHPEIFLYSLSLGNVSGIRNYDSQNAGDVIQITNPISMGNSGGVVLNEYGELIGVPSWSLEYEDNIVQVQNINFATPLYEAMAVLEETDDAR